MTTSQETLALRDGQDLRPPSLPFAVFQPGHRQSSSVSSSDSDITLYDNRIIHPGLKKPTTTFTVHDIPIRAAKKNSYDSYDSYDSFNPSLTEKGQRDSWHGYETQTLPPKQLPKTLRDLRHIVLNVYRRLFTFVVLINLIVFIWVVGPRDINLSQLGNIVLGNIFVSILIRQDHIVNGLFWLFTSVPQRCALLFQSKVDLRTDVLIAAHRYGSER
ncbi:hypothetical protein FRB94_010841 [Tulasnella sp. JGI-2019a]|nr:hypothetical protein FRB93_003619 [Tulasnella sp. JGI-2019a]KAG8993357.1 hypothetical protein FRB94_010841 [Tulasnella sp. JGI-2019a]KAG9031097.1 hypothetical protein FRB95_003143 [Tulasnella sp. JGI-2019a]